MATVQTQTASVNGATAAAPTTFLEQVEHAALVYREWGTPTGDWLAREVGKLAQLVAWTHAQTPDQYDDRIQAWEAEVREQYEARGYDAGLRSRCDPMV